MRLETSADFTEMTTALSRLFGVAETDPAASRLLLVSAKPAHLERLRLATAMLACEIHTAGMDSEPDTLLLRAGFDLILLDRSLAPHFSSDTGLLIVRTYCWARAKKSKCTQACKIMPSPCLKRKLLRLRGARLSTQCWATTVRSVNILH